MGRRPRTMEEAGLAVDSRGRRVSHRRGTPDTLALLRSVLARSDVEALVEETSPLVAPLLDARLLAATARELRARGYPPLLGVRRADAEDDAARSLVAKRRRVARVDALDSRREADEVLFCLDVLGARFAAASSADVVALIAATGDDEAMSRTGLLDCAVGVMGGERLHVFATTTVSDLVVHYERSVRSFLGGRFLVGGAVYARLPLDLGASDLRVYCQFVADAEAAFSSIVGSMVYSAVEGALPIDSAAESVVDQCVRPGKWAGFGQSKKQRREAACRFCVAARRMASAAASVEDELYDVAVEVRKAQKIAGISAFGHREDEDVGSLVLLAAASQRRLRAIRDRAQRAGVPVSRYVTVAAAYASRLAESVAAGDNPRELSLVVALDTDVVYDQTVRALRSVRVFRPERYKARDAVSERVDAVDAVASGASMMGLDIGDPVLFDAGQTVASLRRLAAAWRGTRGPEERLVVFSALSSTLCPLLYFVAPPLRWAWLESDAEIIGGVSVKQVVEARTAARDDPMGAWLDEVAGTSEGAALMREFMLTAGEWVGRHKLAEIRARDAEAVMRYLKDFGESVGGPLGIIETTRRSLGVDAFITRVFATSRGGGVAV